MSEKKALLIINPVSGTRSKHGLGKFVTTRLSESDIKVKTALTKKSGDAMKMAREAAESGFDMVITAGGDGTVNEVANGLAFTDCRLGILPFGSGNGLARSLGIPQDIYAALKVIEDSHSVCCDRGLANGKPFYCTFGIGFDATVSEKFANEKRRGRSTYIRSVLREFLNYKSQSYAILIDGKVITEKALIIAVCNASQYGNNAYIAPKAKLTDGFLDITVVHSGNPFSNIFVGVDLMAGNIDKNRSIETFKTPSVTITRLSDGPVHLDGEPLQMGHKIDIVCEPATLNVFAPEKEIMFRPIVSPLRAMFDDIRYDLMDKIRHLD
ncbi:MAG: diacylglycerol kinase family lipid kinase [Muribaculaceae bacterium]|nr:diacylglycerol kinase family lipid kinase [Muribaculaceae bacterium]